MSKAKFSHQVYAALRDAGMSNRQIARELHVNEASVRRALGPGNKANYIRTISAGLDPWPEKRPSTINFMDTPQGTFIVSGADRRRLLRVDWFSAENAELGKAVRDLARRFRL